MRTIFLFFLLSVPALAVDVNTVADAVKTDKISELDLRKWYSIYKGAAIYLKEYDAVGSNDFGDVFDKLRVVRDKALPAKGNVEFVKATDLTKFEEMDFTLQNKSELASEFEKIGEGLKKAIKDGK
jgi:hypothetical protein